jgi:uncharacterized membrane protein
MLDIGWFVLMCLAIIVGTVVYDIKKEKANVGKR